MWKRCFGDPDDYMELYFRYKYRPEDTLLYIEGSEAVASLQMLTYQFTFHGVEIPVIYLSGVCTLPAYRGRGYARALLFEALTRRSDGSAADDPGATRGGADAMVRPVRVYTDVRPG